MISRQPFGNTGHASTRTIFGGAAITERFTDEEAERLLELLNTHGINHIDTAPVYGAGNSEAVIGRWMEGHRDRFFLATKTGERGYREAWESILASLKALRVDYVDLIQLHNLTDQEGWERALGPQGFPGSVRGSAQPGSRPVHRGHRTRLAGPADAPFEPGAVSL